MKQNDSSRPDKQYENRSQRVKRSASLFMESNYTIEDSVALDDECEGIDLGDQTPKRRHKSLPLSFIATSEESNEMLKLELSPSASMNFGINPNYGFEAKKASDKISHDFLEMNFNSPGPSAPIRQASSKSLLQFDNDLTIKGEFMDLESSEIEKYFGDNEQEKSSPSSSPASSPKASSSRIETAKKNITDKLK